MKKRTVAVMAVTLVLLIQIAVAIGPNWSKLQFRDGTYTAAVAATEACTTKWYTCFDWRYGSLYWQQYVNVGAADSALYIWEMQYAIADTLFPDSEIDTVRASAISTHTDTLGAQLAFNESYYPELAWRIRFMATGLTGCSDSGNVTNVYVTHDDGK